MRYLLLVSHGTFAGGLRSVLDMLGGGSDAVLSCSLEDGMGADEYVERLEAVLDVLTPDDEVVVLGDVLGGSPLTNAVKVLEARGLLGASLAFGGANLPMALTALLQPASLSLDEVAQVLLDEGKSGVKQLVLSSDQAEDDEDI